MHTAERQLMFDFIRAAQRLGLASSDALALWRLAARAVRTDDWRDAWAKVRRGT